MRIAIYALAPLLTFSAGFYLRDLQASATIADMRSEAAEMREKAIADSRRIEQLRADRTAAQDAIQVLREQKAKVIEREVQVEVVKYVQSDNARKCGLDSDGVRILNAAASGVSETGEAPGPADAGTGAVTNARLVPNVAGNYLVCNRNAERLRALQEWVKANG